MRRRQFITRGMGAVAAIAEWGDRPQQLAEFLAAPAEHDAPA